jgi:hypothetical protein
MIPHTRHDVDLLESEVNLVTKFFNAISSLNVHTKLFPLLVPYPSIKAVLLFLDASFDIIISTFLFYVLLT